MMPLTWSVMRTPRPPVSRRLGWVSLAGAATLGGASAVAHAQTPTEPLPQLLQQVLQTYGGPQTGAFLERGLTTSQRKGTGTVTRLWSPAADGALRFRIEIAYPSGPERRHLLRGQAWQDSQAANAAFRGAVMVQAARVGLPWQLPRVQHQLQDEGLVRAAEGAPVRRVLTWTLEPGIRLRVEIDPETHWITRTQGTVQVMGQEMPFATDYADFQAARGGQPAYAQREMHYAMGQSIGSTQLQTVKFIPDLPDAGFRPLPPHTPDGSGGGVKGVGEGV